MTMIGLLGKKLGMTHVYDEYGHRRAVTAVQAGPCTVIRLREPKRDGYQAVQVGFEPIDEKKLSKPRLGVFKKAGTGAFRYLREFRLGPVSDTALVSDTAFKIGQQLTVNVFKQFELVDVIGVSIGKGFQGGMRRWNWKGGSQTHGSTSHRRPGSIGSTTTPGRVVRGHHLPGHMGHDRVTIQNLRILQLDTEHHLLLVEGSVPGAEEGLVIIQKSKKRPGVIKKPQALQTVVVEEEAKGKKPAKPAKK
ncbi:MAG: 50S ribosomal protein L3 [Candidatus Omnitrophota bacterium]|nr:50S ribosomal protein L3 [Candidatus Omnitrophota bacterium]